MYKVSQRCFDEYLYGTILLTHYCLDKDGKFVPPPKDFVPAGQPKDVQPLSELNAVCLVYAELFGVFRFCHRALRYLKLKKTQAMTPVISRQRWMKMLKWKTKRL